MQEILELKKKVGENSPLLHRKPFFWDGIIFIIASSIFGLSISGLIVEFFKSDKNAVACFSPFDNPAQYTYVNSYCHKYLPIAEYFAVALVIHAAALVVPHYLWKVFFSAQFNSFFRHAAKLETLREANTGKYPPKNYYIVKYLQTEFGYRQAILGSYILKLLLQFGAVILSIAVNLAVFTGLDSNINFECYDDETRQLFGNVTCTYPRKLFINVLEVADYFLLILALLVIMSGLLWIFFYNHSTEDDKIAKFCCDSGIDPQYYYNKPSRKLLSWFPMRNNFSFLLASLLATDSGLRRVFKAILIEDTISQIFNNYLAHYEKDKGTQLHIL